MVTVQHFESDQPQSKFEFYQNLSMNLPDFRFRGKNDGIHWIQIAQFAITINSNVCPHIRVPNMLMRNPMHDVIGIFNSAACY